MQGKHKSTLDYILVNNQDLSSVSQATINEGQHDLSSDHNMVWLDIPLPAHPPTYALVTVPQSSI